MIIKKCPKCWIDSQGEVERCGDLSHPSLLCYECQRDELQDRLSLAEAANAELQARLDAVDTAAWDKLKAELKRKDRLLLDEMDAYHRTSERELALAAKLEQAKDDFETLGADYERERIRADDLWDTAKAQAGEIKQLKAELEVAKAGRQEFIDLNEGFIEDNSKLIGKCTAQAKEIEQLQTELEQVNHRSNGHAKMIIAKSRECRDYIDEIERLKEKLCNLGVRFSVLSEIKKFYDENKP